MNVKSRKLVTLAMLSALAYVVMLVGRLPITPVAFLEYDPKDIIIVIGGFLFGPLSSALMSIVVSLVEMVTVSDTGVIGLVMNILSTCSFACVAAAIYKHRPTLKNAVIGLLCGLAAMTGIMLLWNYFITPLYMGVTRQEVAGMLLPIFLPFNVLKGGLNMAVAMLIYTPVVGALRKARLVPPSEHKTQGRSRSLGTILVAFVLLATCVLSVLVFRGII